MKRNIFYTLLLLPLLLFGQLAPEDCQFDSSLITTYSGFYDAENSLSITSSTNELVFALSQGNPGYDGYGVTNIIEGAPIYQAGFFDVCLDPEECYTIKMTDHYGDGWNGAYFTLNNESFSLPSGSEISYNYGQGCEVEVCTDSLYSYELYESSYFGVSIIDFNSNQTLYSVAGGSTGEFCLNPEGCYVLQLSNSFGDAYNNSYYNYFITIENQEFYFNQGEVVGGGAYSTVDPYLTTFSDIFGTGCIISGCTDSLSDNFNEMAIVNDGSCQLYEFGCMDSTALNYNSEALLDHGLCLYDCITEELEEITTTYDCSSFNLWDCDNNEGCSWLNEGFMGFTGCTGGEITNTDYYCNGNLVVFGCTSTNYLEYDPEANFDDGSCTNITTSIGCMDPEASNYNPEATIDYGFCEYIISCNTPYIYNDSLINYENNSNITWNFISETGEDVQIDFYGSTEESNSGLWDYINLFDNYGTLISTIDGNLNTSFVLPSGSSVNFISDFSVTRSFSFVVSLGEGCGVIIPGCTDTLSLNFNYIANTDDGSCIPIIQGCTDASADNYDSSAAVDDGSCEFWGCTDVNYLEYNVEANLDDGSCLILIVEGCTNPYFLEYDDTANEDDGSCLTLAVLGCTDMSASNFNSLANTDDESCISWEEAYNTAFSDGVASVEFPECQVVTQNIPLHLPQGWSMFGYTCLEPLDVMEGFTSISESITIVKDELGSAYLAAWNFNAIGDFTYGKGYQIKMIEEVTDFQFCSTIVGTSSPQDETDLGPLQIGDQHAGGIVFQIYDDGTGLVADLQDLGQMNWDYAMSAAESATSQGYDDWYLPSESELELMCNTIWGADNDVGGYPGPYWSSSVSSNNQPLVINPANCFIFISTNYDINTASVRVIRAF